MYIVFFICIPEYNYIRQREINYVLDKLNRASTYCNREWLNNNGMVVQEGTTSNIFQTLSLAFGEPVEIMAEKIRKELTKVNHLVRKTFC